MTGRLYGIGLGPGDPELLTLKALRLIQAAPVVSYFAKEGRRGNARAIVDQWMTGAAEEIPLYYPMTTEHAFDSPVYVSVLAAFYENAVTSLSAHLDAGRDVALLAEGDPLFYGSFMHLHVRLKSRYPTEIIPGVSGMSGCWSAVGFPIAQGDDVFTVLPGTLPQDELERRLADADAAVVMKLGRHLAKVRRALDRAGLLARAIYVERGTTADAVTMRLADKADDDAPYFAVVLVPGWAGRGDVEHGP